MAEIHEISRQLVIKQGLDREYAHAEGKQEEFQSFRTSQAIEMCTYSADKALASINELSSCIWSKLVLAQAKIEALQSELRAAREGEERAYEALKRLRTRQHSCARSSSRSRAYEQEDSTNVTPDDKIHSTRHHAHQVSLITEKSSLFRELEIAQERLAAGAKREEDLRNALSQAQSKLTDDYWATLGKESVNFALREELHELRRKVVNRDGELALLSKRLEHEMLMSARHRDAAATVPLLS